MSDAGVLDALRCFFGLTGDSDPWRECDRKLSSSSEESSSDMTRAFWLDDACLLESLLRVGWDVRDELRPPKSLPKSS